MSVNKIWKDINDEKDVELTSLIKKGNWGKLASHNPLQSIKKTLLMNIAWTAIICIAYMVIIFYFNYWQLQLSIGVVFIFSLWALYTAYILYKKIKSTVSSSASLLSELKRHHQSVTNWINMQQKIALFIYPVSVVGGFLLGGVIGSGKSVEALISKPLFFYTLFGAIIIVVPACYYLAKWMFTRSFGKHLQALQENIDALESEK